MKDNVLVVEDEKNIREGLEELLTLRNFEVMVAADCSTAMQHLNKTIPDIILCDIMMPTSSGYDLLQEIQQIEKFKKIPFIFISARAELPEIRYGMNLGADDYITKPFDCEQLLTAIKVRLNKRSQFEAHTFNDGEPARDIRKKDLQQYMQKISKSELRVLGLLSGNLSSAEISKQLFLSVKTVQNHKANIVKKLAMEGQNTLLSFAIECRVLGLL